MGLFAAVTSLFKRSSGTARESQIDNPTSTTVATSSVTTTTSDSSTASTTSSTSIVDISEEEACPCGGSCTCQEESEEEVDDSSSYDLHSFTPPTIQATFPGMDELPPVKVRKIEDASTLPRISPEKMKQAKLPGFEDDPIVTSKVKSKKKSTSKKSSAKLTRKSTAKRKK